MSNGVLCFAHNNGKVNYLQQAEELAKRVKQHLNLPTTLVTSTSSELQNPTLFDKVIEIADNNENVKRYYNGTLSHQRLSFKNNDRVKSYELSPYDNVRQSLISRPMLNFRERALRATSLLPLLNKKHLDLFLSPRPSIFAIIERVFIHICLIH